VQNFKWNVEGFDRLASGSRASCSESFDDGRFGIQGFLLLAKMGARVDQTLRRRAAVWV
jgi:hypothetical protein